MSTKLRHSALILIALVATALTACNSATDCTRMPRYTAQSSGADSVRVRLNTVSLVPVLLPTRPMSQLVPEVPPPRIPYLRIRRPQDPMPWLNTGEQRDEECEGGICRPPISSLTPSRRVGTSTTPLPKKQEFGRWLHFGEVQAWFIDPGPFKVVRDGQVVHFFGDASTEDTKKK